MVQGRLPSEAVNMRATRDIRVGYARAIGFDVHQKRASKRYCTFWAQVMSEHNAGEET